MVGLSTDEKPTGLENASSFVELDTGKTYIYDAENTEWVEQPTHGGGGGGGTSSGNSVRFIDYDGTMVNSYSRDDFLALSEMPANPAHEGLVAQGWNWSFENAQTYMTNYPEAILTIGQMYTTDNGDTRLYIYIDPDTPANRMTFYVRFQSSVANNVTIDWGDGTVETVGSTTATNYPHTYASTGDFVIKLTVNSGTILFTGSAYNSIFGSTSNPYSANRGRIRKIEIGDNVTNIGDSAVLYCYLLASITIPKTATIGSNTFAQCRSLTSVTVPKGVTSIGSSTLSLCRSLASIALPDSVTNIASTAFAEDYSLSYITIPEGVTTIGNNAFSTCHALMSITIPEGVTSIGGSAFSNCSALASVTIPEGVMTINSSTFTYCDALMSITIPEGVTSIGSSAFSNCHSLTTVTIPEGVTSIGSSAFSNCHSLTTVTIPESVTSIESSAFYGCYGLGEVHLRRTTPPTLSNSSAFSGNSSDRIFYVPYSEDHSVLEAYKTATNWSSYANNMVEESA